MNCYIILLVRQDAKDRLSNMSFRMALSKKKAQLLIHSTPEGNKIKRGQETIF